MYWPGKHKRRESPRNEHPFEWPERAFWILAACTVIFANLAATTLWETMNMWSCRELGQFSILRFAYLFLFVVLAFSLFWGRPGKVLKTRTPVLSDQTAEPRKHLIIFLSHLTETLTTLAPTLGVVPKALFDEMSIHGTNPDINRDLHYMVYYKLKLKKFWPWEMPLRAIRHHSHADTLETVTVICSRESLPQLHLFIGLCRKYPRLAKIDFFSLVKLPDRLVMVCPLSDLSPPVFQGWRFDRFDDLSRALEEVLKQFKKYKFRDLDVMIDFTSGQKVNSVIAALATSNSQVKAQYVQTNDPWEVESYYIQNQDTGPKGLY